MDRHANWNEARRNGVVCNPNILKAVCLVAQLITKNKEQRTKLIERLGFTECGRFGLHVANLPCPISMHRTVPPTRHCCAT